MEVSGINNKIVNNTLDNAKNKVADDSFEKRLKSAMDKNDEKELKKACQDFEGILLGMMYKEMRATVPKTELIPEDSGNEIFQSMLDDKLVEEGAKGRSIGLADMLFKQLDRQLKATYKIDDGGNNGVGEKK